MADVTLAECNGNIWLVSGEQHVGNLLMNDLPPEISVEIIALDTREQVFNLWRQNCGEPASPCDPILVNPKIADRVRRGSPNRTVFFSQWSAMLDDEAVAVLRSAATYMLATPGLNATLVEYVATDGLPGVADISRLRLTLVEAKLADLGISANRIRREVRTPTDTIEPRGDSQRIGLEIALAPAS